MDSISKKPNPQLRRPEEIPIPVKPQRTRPERTRLYAERPTEARKKKTGKKSSFLKRLFIILLCGSIAWGGYFAWKMYRVSKTIQMPSHDQTATSTLQQVQSLATSLITATPSPLKGEADGRINILLLGRAGEHHPGHDLTDTIMMMSIDTTTKKIALLSLPRDLYVQIPDTHSFTKINAVYQYGLSQDRGTEFIEKTVEKITGQPIQYSFIIDFDGFEKVIEALGGINVEVMRDIYDPRYPGPNYSYETFEIKKGWQTLDGPTALKYVRERHNDPEGDFGRAKRQQQVIQAVKSKAFSLKTFVDVFSLNDLLTILGASVKTTIAGEDIPGFIALSKQVDTNNIGNVVVDAWKPNSLLRVSHVMVGPTRMFTLVPRVGNYSEIQDVAQNLFDLTAIKRRTDAITAEDTSISILNRSSNPRLTAKIRNILQENFGFKQVTVLTDNSTEASQDDSVIIDKTSRQKPFSLDELLKKLPITLKEDDGSLPQASEGAADSSDFIIVLGDNLGKDLDFEEDSVDDFKKSEDDNIAYPSDMTN